MDRDFYLLNGDWSDPLDQEELVTTLFPVKAWHPTFTVWYDPPIDQRASIDWRLIRDQFLPDSNQFIDDAFRFKFSVPLKKTETIVSGVATEYDRHIITLAAIYIALRIETWQYSAAKEPGLSEYSKFLETQLNQLVNDIVVDKVRLRGQRLKGAFRTVNPRFEPLVSPSTVRQTDNSAPAVQPFSTNTQG